ncbi:hypothetical protein LOC71_06685 [Rhodopirellula sp. JC740]|uniref:Uncharacterized protein n=1 Tax=Rhodopirellula halodulae TaxID=2894198 RepID=A0ABS8NEH2_9BACT|nr:hypothetical protein [Rhodopirellula sp. JC740]MCC9641955.1 hypothetical protein [Rhodopirellula sp. JC740]
MKITHNTFAMLLIAVCSASSVQAQGRTVARLFWQDYASADLKWGDLKKSKDGYSLDEQSISNFPKLDVDEQTLVQMQTDDGLLVVGVRDEAGGDIGSGWIAIETGTERETHGDHFHWRFNESPSVLTQLVDENQGNPAHLYLYGKTFAMANDQRNGVTLMSAKSIREGKTPSECGRFVEAGGGHITLAVAEDRVLYSTWIQREGEQAGQVDVVSLAKTVGDSNAGAGRYSIHCPTGGLHGATYNRGKVFLAPTDGVCWVNADLDASQSADSVTVNHISLGKDSEDKPLRTGAFTNLGDYVVFSTGKASESRLCWLNASADRPELQSLGIQIADDQSLRTPIAGFGPGNSPVALCFAESKESPDTDQLYVVSLDPNGDGDFADAKAGEPMQVGPSQLEGHFGHHDAVFLPRGRQIAVTNPGDASIWVISLRDQTVEAKLECKGTPTSLISISD